MIEQPRSPQSNRGAIPTKFDGVEYRSRLEAKWASFIRKIGWDFTYEPLDGVGYIPDFIVYGDCPLFLEVKPAITLDDYKNAVPKINGAGLAHDVLIVGTTPFASAPQVWHDKFPAGWLGERGYYDHEDDNGHAWDYGLWFQCIHCNTINVFHSVMSFHGRPCGHYDGDGYLGTPPYEIMKRSWVESGNDVKWRGKDVK